ELMLFGGLFLSYTVYRLKFTAEFEAGSEALNLWFGGVNTVVLLTSSLTMALAVYWAQSGQRQLLTLGLLLTPLLGLAFLVIKGFEYYHDYEEDLMPGLAFNDAEWTARDRVPRLVPQHVKMFLVIYYIMTGVHALHLIIGITILTILAVMSHRGRFTPAYY